MISNLELVDNPKVRAIAKAIYDLGTVADVRFWPALADNVKKDIGENGVIFMVILCKDGEWRRAHISVTEEMYNDESHHEAIVNLAKERISELLAGENPNSRPKSETIEP